MRRKRSAILGNCAALLILVAVTLTVLFQLFAKPFLLTFGASRNTIGFAMDYIRIYACGTIFVQLTLGLNAFITAQGFAKIGVKTTLIGAITNIILDPILIFVTGLGGTGCRAGHHAFPRHLSALMGADRFLSGPSNPR